MAALSTVSRLPRVFATARSPCSACRRHFIATARANDNKSAEQLAREKAFDEEWDRLQAQEQETTRDDAAVESSNAASVSAAAFLLEQALEEEALEAEARRKEPVIPELREKAWEYGPHAEEPQVQALKRILEDQYKPLRIKGYKKPIPSPAPLESRLFAPPTAPPTPQENRPREVWEYTFKSPNERYPSIRAGVRLPGIGPSGSRGGRASRTQRLASALEKSWDYGSGFRGVKPGDASSNEPSTPKSGGGGRRPMGGMRAWNQMVEDKIEEARQDGLFRNLKGRGKPIPKDENESNPFISRDDFLINRIVQSQGAAPPWVELQIELDQELTNFRAAMLANWQRRAVRLLSLGGVSRTSIQAIQQGTHRDPEWESRERTYHEMAVTTLNGIVRRYNGIAPYAVRRAPIRLDFELEKCFRDSQKVIEEELRRRYEGRPRDNEGLRIVAVDQGGGGTTEGKTADREEKAVDETMWTGFKRLVRQWTGAEPSLLVDHTRR